jgi:hypothetical protein
MKGSKKTKSRGSKTTKPRQYMAAVGREESRKSSFLTEKRIGMDYSKSSNRGKESSG